MKNLITVLLILLAGLAHAQINDDWSAVKVGDVDMAKMYVGETLVWQKTVSGAPAYVSAGAFTLTSNFDSISVPYPSSVSSGDFLVMFVFKSLLNSAGSFGTPAGWAKVANTESSGDLSVAMFVKYAGSSEPSSVTVTADGVEANGFFGRIHRYTGVNSYSNTSATPVDIASGSTVAAQTFASNVRNCVFHIVSSNRYSLSATGTYIYNTAGNSFYGEIVVKSASNGSYYWGWNTTSNVYNTTFNIQLTK